MKKFNGYTLAEGATHVDMPKKLGSFGFTLAEVLITLAIVGVVAALTLPSLIQNYQKQALVNQLKKSYSMWSQAFQKILADEDVEKLSDTELWSKHPGYCSQNDISGCNEFLSGMQKYLKLEFSSAKENNEYKGGYEKTAYLFKLEDGSLIRAFTFFKEKRYERDENKIKELGGNMLSEIGFISIDVNGFKGPNESGKDIFLFKISNEGKLYPKAGKDDALHESAININSNRYYWKNDTSSWGCNNGYSGRDLNSGCAAKIMEEGWKMNY